jgi:hypothetical protein
MEQKVVWENIYFITPRHNRNMKTSTTLVALECTSVCVCVCMYVRMCMGEFMRVERKSQSEIILDKNISTAAN